MKNLLLSVCFMVILGLTNSACRVSVVETSPPQNDSARITPSPKKIAVVADDSIVNLSEFLTSKGYAVENFPIPKHYEAPAFSGDYLVWLDENFVVSYRFSTQTFETLYRGTKKILNVAISYPYVAWIVPAVSGSQIYLYDLTTKSTSLVREATESAYSLRLAGNMLAWIETASTIPNVYAYQISQQSLLPVSVNANDKQGLSLRDGFVVWLELDSDPSYHDIMGYEVGGVGRHLIAAAQGNGCRATVTTNHVVWIESGIKAYRISDQQQYAIFVGNIPWMLSVSPEGDKVTWAGTHLSNYRIYVSSLEAPAPQVIVERAEQMISPSISGNKVVWRDQRFGGYLAIFGYDLDNPVVGGVQLSTIANENYDPVIIDNRVIWAENGPLQVYRYTDDFGTTHKTVFDQVAYDSLLSRLSTFDAIVIGDRYNSGFTLSLFNAVNAAKIPILGVGTGDNGSPLGGVFCNSGNLYGLSCSNDDGVADMAIDVTAEGASHAIFSGLNVASTLLLEENANEQDEIAYTANGPSVPADFKVLANLGPSMSNSGSATIVEFTTAEGTPVLLDGSANTYDNQKYWKADRWTLLDNEIKYLVTKKTP